MRILVTENCNAKCPHCFNASYREKKEIDINTYIRLCEYLSSNNIRRIRIMGGEPTVHSSFEEIIKISQSYFESIVIFSNAMNNRIANIHPRSDDSIVYNFRFISPHFNINKFLLNKPGRRRLEVQIGSKTNIENIICKLSFFKNIPHLKINLTLDCMENVFDNKKVLEEKFTLVSDFIKNDLNTDYIIDHIIPSCLFGEKIKTPDALCSINCAGLIDSSLRLRYCNQYPVDLGNILDSCGDFISYDEITAKLKIGYYSKIALLENSKCNDCNSFLHKCNGGCFAHKCL